MDGDPKAFARRETTSEPGEGMRASTRPITRGENAERTPIWRLRRRAQLQGTADAYGGILIDTYNATICRCNDSAWTVLNALKYGATLEQITATLVQTYSVSSQQAESDALDFVQRLIRIEFVDER